MPNMTCGNCACWELTESAISYLDKDTGLCKRYPKYFSKFSSDYCFEFRHKPPPKEILETDIDLLTTSPETRYRCSTLRLRTVKDLLQVGQAGITYKGSPDKNAIRELTIALKRLGVEWCQNPSF